jgi:hypothetical protein
MILKVLVDSINKETFQNILDFYNSNKPEDEEPLERLDRTEGGFQIKLKGMQDKMIDENEKIRQVRWSNGRLVSGFYLGFTEKQYMLLYESLVYGLGGNVLLEK